MANSIASEISVQFSKFPDSRTDKFAPAFRGKQGMPEALKAIGSGKLPDGFPHPLPLFFVSVDYKRLRFLVSPLESTLAALA
jgi:hypothetical protein